MTLVTKRNVTGPFVLRLLIFIVLFCFPVFNLPVAAQVESQSFDLLLKKMLAHSVEEISVQHAINSNAIFFDAREKKEFEVSHIKNARWVGFETFSMNELSGFDKGSEIIVYCSVGYRSEKISVKLLDAGFQNVSNLYGGIFEWVNQGNPVYRNDTLEVKDIHAYNRLWGAWLKKGNKVFE